MEGGGYFAACGDQVGDARDAEASGRTPNPIAMKPARFDQADAQEEEGEDVGTRFGLTRDRLDGFRRDDAVADRGTDGECGEKMIATPRSTAPATNASELTMYLSNFEGSVFFRQVERHVDDARAT